MNEAKPKYMQAMDPSRSGGEAAVAPGFQGGMVLRMNFEEEEGLEEDPAPPKIGFSVESEGVTWFEITFEQSAGPEEWERLADACRSTDRIRLDWEPSDGDVSISTSERLVHFTVDKAGEGDGGTMTTSFAKEACVIAFDEASRAVCLKWVRPCLCQSGYGHCRMRVVDPSRSGGEDGEAAVAPGPQGGMVLRMNLEEEEEEEEDEEDPRPPKIGFSVESEGVKWFEIAFEQSAGPEEWERLADACRSTDRARLDWDPIDGDASISISERLVHFTVSKAGEGDGGTMTTSFAKEACVGAFEEAAKASRAACLK